MEKTLPVTPEELRAISHPVRLAMLENLGYRGPLTATQLADIVDESPSNCSWHLRKLAAAGMVERVPGSNGRDRPWRLTFASYDFADSERDEQVRALLVHRQVDRMLRVMAATEGDAAARATAAGASPEGATGHEDASPAFHGSNGTWLTDDEARSLVEVLRRLQAMLPDADDMERRRVDPAARPEGARLYEFVGWLVPVEEEL